MEHEDLAQSEGTSQSTVILGEKDRATPFRSSRSVRVFVVEVLE